MECKDDTDWVKCCITMEVDRIRQRDTQERSGVREDMERFGVFQEDAQDWNRWSRKVKGQLTNPGLPGKWP